MNEITPKFRYMCLYMMFIKFDIDFNRNHDNSVRSAADAKTTKLHVENVQAPIKRNKNDTCVVRKR